MSLLQKSAIGNVIDEVQEVAGEKKRLGLPGPTIPDEELKTLIDKTCVCSKGNVKTSKRETIETDRRKTHDATIVLYLTYVYRRTD